MEEKFFRLIAGQQFLIEPYWGHGKLIEINALSEIVDSDANMFADMRERSQQVDYFANGNYTGEDSENLEQGSIAKVSMSGIMTVEDGLCHYGMKSLDRRMRTLYADSRVRGIILSIDSGGGQAAAGNMLYNTIADRNKPVIAHYNFMASAALMGALPSDEIIAASDMSRAGSIGVMMSIPKWYINSSDDDSGVAEFYSRKSPRKNEVWRALESGDTEKLIDMLTELDEIFMAKVKQDRKLKGKPGYVKETLSGAMFTANQARRRGLADGTGSFNYALKRMKSAIKFFNYS